MAYWVTADRTGGSGSGSSNWWNDLTKSVADGISSFANSLNFQNTGNKYSNWQQLNSKVKKQWWEK